MTLLPYCFVWAHKKNVVVDLHRFNLSDHTFLFVRFFKKMVLSEFTPKPKSYV
jgi:hypothetical protein